MQKSIPSTLLVWNPLTMSTHTFIQVSEHYHFCIENIIYYTVNRIMKCKNIQILETI
jgi:hypothetical protein